MSLKHCAVLIKKDGKFLFLRRSDDDKREPSKWNPVNETPEDGEAPEHTAVRGAKEEASLDFKITQRLPDWIGANGHTTYIFIGEGVGDVGINFESSEYGWFSIDEALKLDLAFDYDDLLKHCSNAKLI